MNTACTIRKAMNINFCQYFFLLSLNFSEACEVCELFVVIYLMTCALDGFLWSSGRLDLTSVIFISAKVVSLCPWQNANVTEMRTISILSRHPNFWTLVGSPKQAIHWEWVNIEHLHWQKHKNAASLFHLSVLFCNVWSLETCTCSIFRYQYPHWLCCIIRWRLLECHPMLQSFTQGFTSLSGNLWNLS